MKESINKLLDIIGLSLFDDFLIPVVLTNADTSILKWNNDFIRLFELESEDQNLKKVSKIIHLEEQRLYQYLEKPVKSGYSIKTSTEKGNDRFFRLFSKKISYKTSSFYLIIFFDITNEKESMQYFEQSFDQFMETTINLEKALETIEKQKGKIEVIHKELQDKTYMVNKDMEIASILQNELLRAIPYSANWDMGFFFKGMLGVSGDTYDFHLFKESEYIGVILLDASGHGIASSLITNIARTVFFRNHQRFQNDSLELAMKSTNDELKKQIGNVPNYLTGISLRLYHDSFAYVNSGHPFLLFYDHKTNKVTELNNDGILLGANGFPEFFTAFERNVHQGDIIFAYTDGLSEATDGKGIEFGVERVKKILKEKNKNATIIKNKILEEYASFGISLDKLQDDLTFIIMKKL